MSIPNTRKSGPFGRTIAHGLMTLAFVAQVLNDWSDGHSTPAARSTSPSSDRSSSATRSKSPAPSRRLVERDGETCARVRLVCRAGERQILAGFALQPIENGRVLNMAREAVIVGVGDVP